MEKVKLDTIEEAIEDFKAGNFVIVVDDEDRENEGDLIIAAEKITPEKVNFMLKHARGVLCAPVTVSRCKELDLPHQVSDNTSVLGTPFTVTIDKLEMCIRDSFMGTFFICLFIFMMQFLWKYVDEMVGKGLEMSVLAQFFFYSALTLVPASLSLIHI